jgi:peptide/nickel transport system permease protein
VLIAVPAGTIAALRRNTWLDLLCTTWALFGISVPSFWLGIMLIYLFSVRLRWLPVQGYISPLDDLGASLHAIVLPACTLGVFLSGPLMRYLRSSILHVMSQEHVLAARAKGLAERRVIAGHILRNSFIPFVTVLGVQLGYLLGGAVIIEQIFVIPGIGRLAVQAIGNRDYPLIQGIVLVVALGFVAINIVVDALYSVLDPRIRVGRGSV